MIKRIIISIALLFLLLVIFLTYVCVGNDVTSKRFSESVTEQSYSVLGEAIEKNVEYGNIIGNGNKCATRIEFLYKRDHLLNNWKQINVDRIKWIYQPYRPISITYYDSLKWITVYKNDNKTGRYEEAVDLDDGQLLRKIINNNDTNYGILKILDLEDDEISTCDPRCQ